MSTVGILSPSLEDYIEVIFNLVRENGIAKVKDVAKAKNVKMASVNSALKKLVKEDFINHETYGSINLTEKGASLAKTLVRRHTILKKFLQEIIKVNSEVADKDACAIEHHVHKETIDGLVNYFESMKDK